MKLFLDANVIFTAAYSPNGVSARLFALAEAGFCSLCSSAYAIDEAKRNLLLKTPSKVSHLSHLLPFITIIPEPSNQSFQHAMNFSLPAKDAPIMAAAILFAADILVTGDTRDFGHLFGKTVEGVIVLRPRDALEHLLKSHLTS
ncbi:PIN domain-containing protein [Geomonas sp.]|uniref:PIN domain-containing protein n=1 Tax=Geomonas sp. TaxID=2651584 RepID=UPI002B495757|nr:PIN domain-containing protein [Geomonas sp.]HJV36356.1 PIN domain-containing protein [Geomonas sp.]